MSVCRCEPVFSKRGLGEVFLPYHCQLRLFNEKPHAPAFRNTRSLKSLIGSIQNFRFIYESVGVTVPAKHVQPAQP